MWHAHGPPAWMMEAGWAYSIWWLEQHQRKTSTFCFGVGTFEACRTCDLQICVGRAFRAFSGPCQDTTAGLGALLISLRHCYAESFGSAFTLTQAAVPRFDVCELCCSFTKQQQIGLTDLFLFVV